MNAVTQFRSAQYADAINAFVELNVNPAKVVGLYPESVSGRLAVPEDEWIELFGGPSRPHPKSETASTTEEHERSKAPESDEASFDTPTAAAPRPPSPQGSVRGLLRSGLESLRPGLRKDDELETASIRAKKQECERMQSIVSCLTKR